MRPIPRLDTSARVRKNSIQGSGASASESEDDVKRNKEIPVANNRIRNDSICSVQSNRDTTGSVGQTNQTDQSSPNNVTKVRAGPKRRMLVSESARKLAEARREFLIKHENKTPDRSKLTMYDLIYYNPITNPMKKSSDAVTVQRQISICEPEEKQEEENEDDPSSAMPVPQVKVGPDGQLIIDEQSLVIEQTDAKKGREALAKEAIIEDDNNGSGFYKRRQKSKDWPKWETLKFYKALNTVGTDFLLMQSFFPNRTRQEIKMKFKKEERVNRPLVDKALAYHQEFDTEILEKSLASFEDTEKEMEKQKSEAKDKKRSKLERKRKSRIVATSIGEMDGTDEEEIVELTGSISATAQKMELAETKDDQTEQQQSLKRAKKEVCKRPREEANIVKEETMLEDVGPYCDSDTEIYHVRPTRSGRLPKIKKLQGPDINTLDSGVTDESVTEETEAMVDAADESYVDYAEEAAANAEEPYTETLKTVITDIDRVEPGSLVILSKESEEEPGKSVLQVYMVSSNIAPHESNELITPDITPVDLSPELLATVTTRLSDVKPVRFKEEHE